jgi:ribosomal protein S20
MRKRTTAVTVAGVVGLGGLAGYAVGPAVATAATSTDAPDQGLGSRLSRIKDALASLVTDGTLTQAQADKVASRLDQAMPGPRGHDGDGPDMRGGRLLGDLDAAAAKVLGMTEDEVHQAQRSGSSLAALADKKGVARTRLVDALVSSASSQIDQAVKDGSVTADRATTLKAGLKDRITTLVERTGQKGMRPGGGGGRHGGGGQATPSPSATTEG